MQEELGKFTRNKVWALLPRPKDANVSKTTEFELWYTHDSTTSLKGSYDVEAEDIAASSSWSQLIWIKNRLKDYGISRDSASFSMTLYCENISAFNFFKNLIHYSSHYERQIGYILTKDLDASRYEALTSSLGLCIPSTV